VVSCALAALHAHNRDRVPRSVAGGAAHNPKQPRAKGPVNGRAGRGRTRRAGPLDDPQTPTPFTRSSRCRPRMDSRSSASTTRMRVATTASGRFRDCPSRSPACDRCWRASTFAPAGSTRRSSTPPCGAPRSPTSAITRVSCRSRCGSAPFAWSTSASTTSFTTGLAYREMGLPARAAGTDDAVRPADRPDRARRACLLGSSDGCDSGSDRGGCGRSPGSAMAVTVPVVGTPRYRTPADPFLLLLVALVAVCRRRAGWRGGAGTRPGAPASGSAADRRASRSPADRDSRRKRPLRPT